MSLPKSFSLRIWYSGVFAAGAAALVAGGLLSHAPVSAPERTATAEVELIATTPSNTSQVKKQINDQKKWGDKTSSALSQLGTALKDFQTALDAKDYDSLQAACGRIGVAGRAISSALPAPSAAVTDPLTAAAANFRSVGSQCGSLTAEAGTDVVQGVVNELQVGMSNVQAAQQAIAAAG